MDFIRCRVLACAFVELSMVLATGEGHPCNAHLLSLSERVKAGVKAAGLVGLRFNTVGVSDGISMGTRGMSYSFATIAAD